MTKNKIIFGLATTIKATRQETLDFINYHYNLGIHHLYIFFDNPDDNVINEIDHPNVKCIRCDEKHWKSISCNKTDPIEKKQVKNADLALKWAREFDVDWITHIDSDELIYSERSLTDLITSLDTNIDYLVLPPKESVPTKLTYNLPYREIDYFKILPHRLNMNKLMEDVLLDGEYFRGHTSGKSFSKISPNLKSLGIHRPIFWETENIDFKIIKDFSILHFDCYSPLSWSKKWSLRISGESTATDCRPNRLKQKQIYQKAYEENDDKAFINAYKKLYFIESSISKELIKQGLLERIQINKNLFRKYKNKKTIGKFRELLKKCKI